MKLTIDTEGIDFPIRINRYLYLANVCSRRQADRYISDGRIKINDRLAVLGDKVQKKDTVTIDEKIATDVENYQYFAFNKPIGIVSHNPQDGERSVADVVKKKFPLHPLGRLDKASHGLMILSNDGRIVNKLLHPNFSHEKEYEVTVDKALTGKFMHQMEQGVGIEGYHTKQAKLTKLSQTKFSLILTEGKKHQIRRMCAALGYQVEDLKRIRVANVKLGDLKAGQTRKLSKKERERFLSRAGLG